MPNIFETTDAAAGTATTYTLLAGQTAQGSLGAAGDHDWYLRQSRSRPDLYLRHDRDRREQRAGYISAAFTLPVTRRWSPPTTTGLQGLEFDRHLYREPQTARITSMRAPPTRPARVNTVISFNARFARFLRRSNGRRRHRHGPILERQRLEPGRRLQWLRQTDDGRGAQFLAVLHPANDCDAGSPAVFYADVSGLSFNVINPNGYTDNATILLSNLRPRGRLRWLFLLPRLHGGK